MLALTWTQSLLALLFVTFCVLLILLILIQKGKGGGLSGAFGGVGSYSPFGTKTGDALTWATVVLTGLYLLTAVLANYAFRPDQLAGVGATITAPAGQAQPIDAGAPAGEQPAVPVGDASAPPVPATPSAAPVVPTPAETVVPADTPAAPAEPAQAPAAQ